MLSQFQASYQRLEQSLQRLTDSIAAYNPSATAADELVAADDAVSDQLETLVKHQANHQRIQALRRTADALDATIKRTIGTLVETRQEVLSIPARKAPDEAQRDVGAEELLSYAKFISKTTVPPTFRRQDVPPFPVANGTAATPAGAAREPEESAARGSRNENIGTKAVDEETRQWLDQALPFEPWPSQGAMQQSILGDIQRMIESGKDPASVLTAEEQAEADRKKVEEEERDRLAQEEAEARRREMFDTSAARRRETTNDVFNPDDL